MKYVYEKEPEGLGIGSELWYTSEEYYNNGVPTAIMLYRDGQNKGWKVHIIKDFEFDSDLEHAYLTNRGTLFPTKEEALKFVSMKKIQVKNLAEGKIGE